MATSGTMVLCLSDIDGFESLTARMPTAEECARINGLSAEVPVLVMRRAEGHEQIYRADAITITIGTAAAPDPDSEREAVRAVLHHVAEDLSNSADDLTWLARALSKDRRDVAEIADELRQRRADQYTGAEVREGAEPQAMPDATGIH